MINDTIYFIEDNDVAHFFSHSFCLIGEPRKEKKSKKQKFKLRDCCAAKQHISGAILQKE